jgi:DHA1 family tetracycline resistance protein-like MFS transporter
MTTPLPRAAERRALGFILVTVFIDMLGFGLVIPVLPVLVATLSGRDIAQATAIGGWLIMSFAIAQFLFAPLLGNLSDRFGRRPVLLVSMAGHGLAYLLAAAAGSIPLLLAARILAGATGASYSTAYAYIADVTPPERRAQEFGLIGVAFGLGFIFGPALGGILGAADHRLPFLAAAALSALNFLFGLFVLPESLARERRRAFDWRRANPLGAFRNLGAFGPPLIRLAMVLFLWGLALQALHGIWSYVAAWRYGWSPFEVGVSLAAVGVAAVAVNGLLVRRSVARFGEAATAVIGLSAGLFAFLLYALADTPALAFVAIAVGALGGLIVPAMQALMTREVPATAQGELQGGVSALNSLTIILGPPLFAQVFAHFTAPGAPLVLPGAPFVLAFALAALALLIFLASVPLGARAAGRPAE